MKTFTLSFLTACFTLVSVAAHGIDLSFRTFVDRYTVLDFDTARHETGYMTKNGGIGVLTSFTEYLFGDEYYELLPISGRPIMVEMLFDSNKQLGLIPALVRSDSSFPIGYSDFVIVSTRHGPDPNPKPTFIVEPESDAVVVGGVIYVSAIADGYGDVSYQWFKNGKPIPGATSFNIWIDHCSKSDAGTYLAVASIGSSSATSHKATIKVLNQVTFRRDLKDITTSIGKTVALKVAAKGAGPITYLWYHDLVPIQTNRSPRLTLRKVTPADAGSYWVWAGDGHSVAGSLVINVSVNP